MEPIANVFELREDCESLVDECQSCPVNRGGDLRNDIEHICGFDGNILEFDVAVHD